MKMVHIYNIYNFALKNRVKIVQKFKNTQNMKLQFFAHYLRYIFKKLPCSATYKSQYLNQSKHSLEN